MERGSNKATIKPATDELWISFPAGKIAEIDGVRGEYLSRSKFILLAVNKIIQEAKNSGGLRIE